MSLMQREDFNGRIANIAKLANEENLPTNKMISIVSKGKEGVEEYFAQKREKPVQEHKSLLDEFQL